MTVVSSHAVLVCDDDQSLLPSLYLLCRCLSAVGKIPAALAKANSNTITTFPRFQQAVEDYHLVHTVEGVYCTFPFLNMQDLLPGGGQDGHHAGNGDK